MTELNLENLLAQAREVLAASERATPGPWRKRRSGCCGSSGVVWKVSPAQFTDRGAMAEKDADMIVLTRNTAPSLARAVLVLARALEFTAHLLSCDDEEQDYIDAALAHAAREIEEESND